MDDLFIYSHTKGNIEYYKTNPKYTITIPSISIKSGKVSENQITQYTYHTGLEMYKISDPEKRFEDFWASSDHSLIVYDLNMDSFIKASPKEILHSPENYMLVQKSSLDLVYEYIPCSEIKIELDPSVTDAGDFTVENDYTFCTFDGIFVQDTQAIYTPLIDESVEEFKEKMINSKNMIVPGSLNFESISQYGYSVYVMTKDEPDQNNVKMEFEDVTIDDLEELLDSKKLTYSDSVKISGILTTVGRLLLALYFKKPELVYIKIDKKVFDYLVTQHIHNIIVTENRNVEYKDLEFVDKLLQKHFVNIPINISIRDFTDAYKDPKFVKLKTEFAKARGSDTEKLKEAINDYMREYVKDKNIGLFIDSRAKGTLENIRQILGYIGTVTSVTKRPIPVMIKRSFSEGLGPTDYLVMSFATRKGSMDRSVNTATTGYLARKLAFAMVEQELGTEKDCGSTEYLEITLTSKNWRAYEFRYFTLDPNSNELIQLTQSNKDEYINKKIFIRTPIFCKSKEGICHTCYPYNTIFNSKYIGIIGSQAISERGTQLIMRTFHTGSIAKNIKDFINPEKFEIKGNLVISKETFEITQIDTVEADEESESLLQLIPGEELKHNVYLLSNDLEYMLPKGLILRVELREGLVIKEGDIVGEVPSSESVDLTSTLDYIIKILDKPDNLTWEEIYDTLMKSFYYTEGIISIHFELLLGNMMRNPDNLTVPYRFVEDKKNIKPTLVSIKRIPKLRPILALGFQEFQQALLSYLGSNDEFKENYKPTIYEKYILGVTKKDLGLTKESE